MSSNAVRKGLGVLCALALGASCAGGGPTAKGEEDAVPVDGRFDSFASPTEHGPIAFGVPSDAAFTDDEHFHAWTFALGAEAEVDLSTVIGSSNVDTVMYLYARGGETDSWGAYAARNDDDGEALSSRIRRVLQAGQYRIVVKAHKLAIRGRFQVLAECDGQGCAAAGVGCSADEPTPLPEGTAFTAACARGLRRVLDAAVARRNEYGIDASAVCSIGDEVERRAVGLYRSYWDGAVGWEDFVYDPEDGVRLAVESMALDGRLTGGTVVRVDLDGADESAIDFVFDLDGELVMLYQHNQSPDVGWFCGAPGEPEADPPGEDCVAAYLAAMPHREDEVSEQDQAGPLARLAESLGGTTAAALEAYAGSRGLDRDQPVRVEVRSWESTLGGRGGQVVVSADGQPTLAYDVADDGYGRAGVVAEADLDSDDVRFVCAGL